MRYTVKYNELGDNIEFPPRPNVIKYLDEIDMNNYGMRHMMGVGVSYYAEERCIWEITKRLNHKEIPNEIQEMEGYCYLLTLSEECREHARIELGKNPLLSDFFDYLKAYGVIEAKQDDKSFKSTDKLTDLRKLSFVISSHNQLHVTPRECSILKTKYLMVHMRWLIDEYFYGQLKCQGIRIGADRVNILEGAMISEQPITSDHGNGMEVEIPTPIFRPNRLAGTVSILFNRNVQGGIRDNDTIASFPSSIQSEDTYTINVHKSDAHKLPHDMVTELLGMPKERRFSERLSELNINYNQCLSTDQTPDYISSENVFEVGTTRGFDLDEPYEIKKKKYEQSLRDLGVVLPVVPIIVSRHSVKSRVVFPQNIINSMCHIYTIFLGIYNKMLEDNVVSKSDADQARQKEIQSMFQAITSLSLPSSDQILLPLITKEVKQQIDEITYDENKMYLKMIDVGKRAYSKMKQIPKDELTGKKFIDEYEDLAGYEVRNVNKSIINHPLIRFQDIKTIGQIPNKYNYDCHIQMLWRSIFSVSSSRDFESIVNDAEGFKSDVKWKKQRTEDKIKNLCKADIDENCRYLLALQGVQAKSFKENETMKLKRKSQQKIMSFDCETADIEDFIMKQPLLERDSECIHNLSDNLVNKAYDIANCGYEGYNREDSGSLHFIDQIKKTRLIAYCEIIDWISQEVNLDIPRKVEKDEFICKKHPDRDIFLLLHPTTVSKHIFYSILIRSDIQFSLPGRKPISVCDDWAYFDFVSTDRHRISVTLGLTQKMVLMTATLLEVNKLSFKDLNESFNNRELVAQLGVYLLTTVSDKAGTTDILQNIRYAYMKAMTGRIINVHPLAILKKFPKPRTRLDVWIYKRVKHVMSIMNDCRPIREGHKCEIGSMDDSLMESDDISKHVPSGDYWKGLKSWVTLENIESAEQAISLSYMGVGHNKDEGDAMQCQFQIFNKIIDLELKMRDARPECMGLRSFESGEEPRTHEFDAEYVKFIGDMTRKEADRRTGSFKKEFESNFQMNMKETMEDFATFKASAEYVEEVRHIHNQKDPRRKKCLQAILDLIESIDEYEYHKVIPKIMKLSGIKGFYADLFKKNQLTGVREIFVLTMADRLIADCTEMLFKSVGQMLPNEMMTKGTQKHARMTSFQQHVIAHKKIVSEGAPDEFVTCTCLDSSDAATWCQQFVMSILYTFSSSLFKDFPDIRHFIALVCNLVTNKKLKLPNSMLDQFLKKRDTNSFQPSINELKDQFLGESDHNDIVNEGEIFLKNRSNFMQGIFGQTFGVLHAGFLITNKRFEIIYLNTQDIDMQSYSNVDQVTSDDSGCQRILTFRNTAQHRYRAMSAFRFMVLVKIAMMKYWCARDSTEKSTNGVVINDVYEFNSIWIVANTELSVLIKFAASTLVANVSSSFEEELHMWSNLRRQLLQAGGSVLLCDIAQICQAETHYSILGSMVLPDTFKQFAKNAAEYPHPSLGFFPLEPLVTVCMLGHNSAKYKLISTNENANKIEHKILKNNVALMTKDGTLTYRLNLFSYSMSNYFNFLERLDLNEDWREYGEMNPRIFYDKKSSSMKDEIHRIYEKAGNTDAALGFTFDTPSKVYSLSAYVLYRAVVIMTTTDREINIAEDLEGKGIVKQKVSINFLLANPAFILSDRTLNESEMNLLYPLRSSYEMGNQIRYPKIRHYHKSNLVTTRRLVKILFEPSFAYSEIGLIDVVSWFWFGIRGKYSDTTCQKALHDYKRVFPWLSKDYPESVENSPFHTNAQLAAFVRGFRVKPSTVLILAPIHPTNVSSVVTANVRNNFMRSHRTWTNVVTDNQDEINALTLELTGPLTSSVKRKNVSNIVLNIKPHRIRTLLARNRSSREILVICLLITYKENRKANSMRHDIDKISEEVLLPGIDTPISLIKSLKGGFISSWTVRQNRVIVDGEKLGWEGTGLYQIEVAGNVFSIVVDNDVTHIRSSNEIRTNQSRVVADELTKLSIGNKVTKGLRISNSGRLIAEEGIEGWAVTRTNKDEIVNLSEYEYDVEIEDNRDYMRVVTDNEYAYDDGRRKMTLFSMTITSKTLNDTSSSKIASECIDDGRVSHFIKKWRERTPLSEDDINLYVERFTANKIRSVELAWIRKSLSQRLELTDFSVPNIGNIDGVSLSGNNPPVDMQIEYEYDDLHAIADQMMDDDDERRVREFFNDVNNPELGDDTKHDQDVSPTELLTNLANTLHDEGLDAKLAEFALGIMTPDFEYETVTRRMLSSVHTSHPYWKRIADFTHTSYGRILITRTNNNERSIVNGSMPPEQNLLIQIFELHKLNRTMTITLGANPKITDPSYGFSGID
jgi:hypothetical protein